MSQRRLGEYRALFRTLGLDAGIEGYDAKDEISFHASSLGLAVIGSSKGYTYCTHRPSLVVADLDDYWSPDGQSFTAFRQIEGQWYLYFDYED